jgi:hypothetical protein
MALYERNMWEYRFSGESTDTCEVALETALCVLVCMSRDYIAKLSIYYTVLKKYVEYGSPVAVLALGLTCFKADHSQYLQF